MSLQENRGQKKMSHKRALVLLVGIFLVLFHASQVYAAKKPHPEKHAFKGSNASVAAVTEVDNDSAIVLCKNTGDTTVSAKGVTTGADGSVDVKCICPYKCDILGTCVASAADCPIQVACQKPSDCSHLSTTSCQGWDCVNNFCEKKIYDGTPCDDGDVCTTGDKCTAGSCGGTTTPGPNCCPTNTPYCGTLGICALPADCPKCQKSADCLSDKNECTDDKCDVPSGKCEYPNNNIPCDDNDLCTKIDKCSNGKCVGGNAVICTAQMHCDTQTGTCVCTPPLVLDPKTGTCVNGGGGGGGCTGTTKCGDGILNGESSTCHMDLNGDGKITKADADMVLAYLNSPQTKPFDPNLDVNGDGAISAMDLLLINAAINSKYEIEQCDDGNTAGGDGCSATCQIEKCGNGTLDVGEECDDGNTVDGDGCSKLCKSESPCSACGANTMCLASSKCADTGGVCQGSCSTQCCPPKNPAVTCAVADGCCCKCPPGTKPCNDACILETMACPKTCGNGVKDQGEQCDPKAPKPDNRCPNGLACAINCACVNPSCFLAGTLITLEDGTQKPIEEIKVGDMVRGIDPEKESVIANKVVELMAPREDDTHYELETTSGKTSVTGEHPFYVGKGEYKKVEELNVGDTIYIIKDNQLAPAIISAKREIKEKTKVYNFHTDGFSNYVASEFVVHNKVINCEFCDDHNKCTAETCELDAACAQSAQNPDEECEPICKRKAVSCPSGICNPLMGCICTKDTDCDDGNVCTTDTCNVATGMCAKTFNTNFCDDNNWCTGTTEKPDRCSGGVCMPGGALQCKAGTCDPKLGCLCAGPGDCGVPSGQCLKATCTNGVCGAAPDVGAACGDNKDVCMEPGKCNAAAACIQTPKCKDPQRCNRTTGQCEGCKAGEKPCLDKCIPQNETCKPCGPYPQVQCIFGEPPGTVCCLLPPIIILPGNPPNPPMGCNPTCTPGPCTSTAAAVPVYGPCGGDKDTSCGKDCKKNSTIAGKRAVNCIDAFCRPYPGSTTSCVSRGPTKECNSECRNTVAQQCQEDTDCGGAYKCDKKDCPNDPGRSENKCVPTQPLGQAAIGGQGGDVQAQGTIVA